MFSLVNFLLSTSLISFLWFYKPVRFYLMSFFFDWLYENPNVGKFLGIKYENDYDLFFRRTLQSSKHKAILVKLGRI